MVSSGPAGAEGGGGAGVEVTHRLGRYEVTVATEFGPRLLGLRRGDSPNILARLDPDLVLDAGAAGVFRFRGGHRLWAAPEIPALTYAADEEPCDVSYDGATLRVSGPVDAAGFRKEIEVRAEGDSLVVDHRLGWQGNGPVRAGAWAITQLPLGGTALLPLGARSDAPPQQADRSLVLWPYTHLSDPRLSFLSDAVLVEARAGSRFKLGSGPVPGLLGYHRDGWLFIKEIEPATNGPYPDRGAVGQVYADEDFCELESLGPLVQLEPGSAVDHREVWQLTRCPDVEAALAGVVGP